MNKSERKNNQKARKSYKLEKDNFLYQSPPLNKDAHHLILYFRYPEWMS